MVSTDTGELHTQPVGFDAARLAFLFEGPVPDLPSQVQFELERFEIIRSAIRDRTDQHVRELQLKRESISFDGHVIESELVRTVGPRIRQTLVSLTDTIIEAVDQALPSIQTAARQLRDAILGKYPSQKIIRFEAKVGGPALPKKTKANV